MAQLNLFNLKGSDFLPGKDCLYVPPDRPFVELSHSLVYSSPLLQSGDIRVNERQPVNTEGIFIITGIQILVPLVYTQATGFIAEPDIYTIDYTAVPLGAGGNGINLNTVNNGANLPLIITVVGKTITVQLRTDGADSVLTTVGELIAALQGNAAASALITSFVIAFGTSATVINATTSGPTSGGLTSQNVLYVRFQWPNGRYTSNIRVDHRVCYAPFKDSGPSLTSNVGVSLPRPIRIEPVVCLPGTDIGIEVENRASLAQTAFAAMIEFRGRLRRFIRS